jgi:hypothetical protein
MMRLYGRDLRLSRSVAKFACVTLRDMLDACVMRADRAFLERGIREMSLETIYSICSGLAFAGWACLALAPIARGKIVLIARAFALILCAAYLAQFFFTTTPMAGASFTSLAGITALFSAPGNVMLGWTHYLAFDLFIGSWIVEDAGKNAVPHWVVLPCLFFTLMLGPIGLGLYFLLRWAWSFWRQDITIGGTLSG